jgi:hypothetical protein
LKVDLGQQELSGFDFTQIETLTDQLGIIHAHKISKLSLLLKRKIMLKKSYLDRNVGNIHRKESQRFGQQNHLSTRITISHSK